MKKRFKKLHTWHIEATVVALFLALVAVLSGNVFREWVGSLAVFVTFLYTSVNNRMAEDQAARPEPSVECFKWSQRYFLFKEVLWLSYFVMSQTWAALAGVFLFLLYPLWRKFYRGRISPL